MAGKLQAAVDVQQGSVMLEELGRLSASTADATQKIKQIGMNYRQFRDGLVGDADDVAYADTSLAVAIARDKATLDAMAAEDRAVVDAYFLGLGYAKV